MANPMRDRSVDPLTDPPSDPLPSPTIQQLAYLVAVADHGTFAAAAASLGVTTSALSQGVAELERRLGVELFERRGRRQVLRIETAEVLAYARRVVADTRDLGRWLAAVRSGRAGRVRVGMIDAAAVHHLHAAMASFRREHADVDLRLVVAPSGELVEQLRRGELDLAVVVEPERPDDAFESTVVVTERLVVVPPDRVEVGEPSTWGPWVLFPRGARTRELVEHALLARGASVDVVAESHQPDVLREMTRLGMGWTVLPEAQAGRRREGWTTVAERDLVLVRPRARSANAAVDEFATSLQA